MILEAFSERLHEKYGWGQTSEQILHEWLLEILLHPKVHSDPVSQVVHTEIRVQDTHGEQWFSGLSPSGERLLDALHEYCKSYDYWRFSRWLHHLRASDFPFLGDG